MKKILTYFSFLLFASILFTTCSKDTGLQDPSDSPFTLKSADGYILANSTEELYNLVYKNIHPIIGKSTTFDIAKVNFTIRETLTEAEVIYNTEKHNRNIIFYWLHDETTNNNTKARASLIPAPIAISCEGDSTSCSSADMPPALPIPTCHVKFNLPTGKYRCVCGDSDDFIGTDLGCTMIVGPTELDCTGSCIVINTITKDLQELGTGRITTYEINDTINMPCVEYYNPSTQDAECRCNNQAGLCGGPSI